MCEGSIFLFTFRLFLHHTHKKKEMKKLEDITYRHELIERYLDADTSVEEELDRKEEMKELDRKEEADGQLQMKEMSLATSKKHETRWVRLSAILLATAMLAGLIFLLFPIKDYFSSSSEQQTGFTNLVPTEQVVRSQPSSEDGNEHLNAYEKMERADSLFLAATQDIVTPQEMKSSKMALAKRKNIAERSENHAEKTAENTEETSSETGRSIHEDFNQIYEVASAALPSAEQLTINRQGDNIVISTLDNEGNMQHYTINIAETQDGSYQLLPLAQLNE